jgi:hypothetical protein
MSTSASEIVRPRALDVAVTEDTLVVTLHDGRVISVPVSWYPRLEHATPAERKSWELIGAGLGIHWPGVDEDISVEALLAGKRSNESDASLHRWLSERGA